MLNNEFNKPKSKAQLVTKFKEIQQRVNESVWDFDQRLKCLIQQANIRIMNNQHRHGYIALLLPHLRFPLTQNKIGTQVEAMEISMRLEASPMHDTNVELQHI